MRGSRVVLALAMTLFAVRVTNAQSTTDASSASEKKCLVRDRGTPSDTGLENRADPTQQGNKDCTPPVLGHATISGNVFFDVDLDHNFGPDEEGLVGWTVVLTGPVNQTMLSADGGAFSFAGLPAGNYTLCVNTLPMWTQLAPTSGASTCSLGIGYSIIVNPSPSDTTITGKNFGYITQ
jgi:hypothetical protein